MPSRSDQRPVRGGERIPEVAKPFPSTGYRRLDTRTAFFYGITCITPAMAMRMTGIGSQYLVAMVDADKNYFDGAKTYKVTLPKGIPEVNFWSLTLYDNQTRSMLVTPLTRGCEADCAEMTVPNSAGLNVLRIRIGMPFKTAGAMV